MRDKPAKANWWTTLPGVLTAVGGIIVAFTGLLAGLNAAGLIGKSISPPPQVAPKTRPAVTSTPSSLPTTDTESATASRSPATSAKDNNPQQPGEEKAVRLIVERIETYQYEDIAVRLTAKVNGLEFIYPSETGAEWMKVGPEMSSQRFDLPPTRHGYDVSFTMTAHADSRTLEFISQWKEHVTKVPFKGTYKLHAFDPQSRTRSPEVQAVVTYSLISDE